MIVDVWISEGFLKVVSSKSLEDVARECLQDLVDKNLVLCGERDGKLSKVYLMHDVLRELALREARKENLSCFNEDFDISLGFRRSQPINSSPISQWWSSLSRMLMVKDGRIGIQDWNSWVLLMVKDGNPKREGFID
nr:putative disease resistance RPP13-like protein 3 [Ipomoea batatas]